MKRKKKVEFSKIILVVASIINILVVLFTMYVVIAQQNAQPLAYLIPSVAAEMAAGTGFYYNKAKAENKIKLMKSCGVEPTGQDFNV